MHPHEMQRAQAGLAPDASSGLFPFDPVFYRQTYEDLRAFDDAEVEAHYRSSGIGEGRVGASAGLREQFLPQVPDNGLVLEIGPFACPALRGPQVRYADVLPKEGLRARAAANGIDPGGCPDIDYVLGDCDLARIPDRFAAVFSSHCVEHQPDLLGHLQAVERLLADNGRYFLIVPDKRYCFDYFLPESSIADVMTAYARDNKIHDLGSVIEHWAMTTHNETMRHWNGDHGQRRLDDSIDMLVHAINVHRADPSAYIDVHAWQFTPTGFHEIVRLLAALGLTRLRPAEAHNTPYGRNEFCATLSLEPDRTRG